MSTAAFADLLTTSNRRSAPGAGRSSYVRRRGTVAQGQALETLGHAVEYLVDCGLFQQHSDEIRANQEAVQILMRLSRAVFAECPEVLPMSQRFRRWWSALTTRSTAKGSQGAS